MLLFFGIAVVMNLGAYWFSAGAYGTAALVYAEIGCSAQRLSRTRKFDFRGSSSALKFCLPGLMRKTL
jgi:hypothetical protein